MDERHLEAPPGTRHAKYSFVCRQPLPTSKLPSPGLANKSSSAPPPPILREMGRGAGGYSAALHSLRTLPKIYPPTEANALFHPVNLNLNVDIQRRVKWYTLLLQEVSNVDGEGRFKLFNFSEMLIQVISAHSDNSTLDKNNFIDEIGKEKNETKHDSDRNNWYI